MDLNAFTFPQQEAATAAELYREQYEKTKSLEDRALWKGYGEIAKGRKVIALANVLRAAGLKANGYPNLAIARADQQRCTVNFNLQWPLIGDCLFYSPRTQIASTRILVPPQTFPKWQPDEAAKARPGGGARVQKQCLVPIVPAAHRPRYALSNYHILWEVESWDVIPPIDPALLKSLGGGLYSIVAVWDLTEMERAVMGMVRSTNRSTLE